MSKKEKEINDKNKEENKKVFDENSEQPENEENNKKEVEVEKEEESSNEEVKEEKDTRTVEEKLQDEVKNLNDKYLRLSAEYDNYRKRSLKEKMDLMKSAGRDIFQNILPVIDNFERALKSMETAEDITAVKEGVILIYDNFKKFLNQRGVTEIECMNKEFDAEYHEAVTKIKVEDKEMKGKIVDVIEKGYMLSYKVLRFPKVVIGE